MYVAVCRLTLHVHGSRSLKDKRRVVVSLRDQLRRRFGVSVAEVDSQEAWQLAVIGIAGVSGTLTTARDLVDRAVEYAESTLTEAVVTSAEKDAFDY